MFGYGPSLRGAGSGLGPSPRTTEREAQYFPREVKFNLKPLPEKMAGWMWYRYRLFQKLRSCNMPPSFVARYIKTYHDNSKDDLKRIDLDEYERELDAKLFDKILDAADGIQYLEHQRRIISECTEGAGMQALKVLDEIYEFNRDQLSTDAQRWIENTSCSSVAQAGAYLAGLKYNLEILNACEQPMSNVNVLSKLKTVIKPYEKEGIYEFSHTYSAYKTRSKADRDAYELIAKLSERYA